MKPEPHLVVGDSFANGAGASAAGDFDLAPLTEQVFSVPRHADGPAALLAPVPKVALFFLSAGHVRGPRQRHWRRLAPHPAGPGAACHHRALPCRLNHDTEVDDPCVDPQGNPSGPGGPAPDGLKEPVSGGSAEREPEQKSSFAEGAARPFLKKAPCSSCPQTMDAIPFLEYRISAC